MCLKKQKGFTIVELLVSTLIMSLGVLGYTHNEMNTIFNVNYSYKIIHATNVSTDFINIVLNEKRTKQKVEDKDILIKKYRDSYWNTDSYPSELKDCESSVDIDQPLLCDEQKRVDYNVIKLKNTIRQEIPDATILMFKCQSGLDCLTVAWQETSNLENECKSNVDSCILMEF